MRHAEYRYASVKGRDDISIDVTGSVRRSRTGDGRPSSVRKRTFRGRAAIFAIGLGIAVAVVAVLPIRGSTVRLGQRTHGITRPAHHADSAVASLAAVMYPVLRSARPNGIKVVPPSRAEAVRWTSAAPVWVAVAPSNPLEILPIVSTARLVHQERSARIWISESTGRGVCLLKFDPAASPRPATDHAVLAYCNGSAELGRGVILSNRGGGTSHLFGVVPTGVSSVSVVQEDGSRSALPVHQNTYSVATATPATEVAFTWRGMRQRYSFQPNRRTQ